MIKKVILPIKFVKIEEDGFHLLVKTKINDKVANLLLDTGASRTVFDLNKKEKFINKQKLIKNKSLATGLGTDKMISHSTSIKKMKFDNFILSNYEGYFIDLSLVNNTYEKMNLKPIDGVLGSDLLNKFKAIIDYKKSELILNL
jgi:hypothetical protein